MRNRQSRDEYRNARAEARAAAARAKALRPWYQKKRFLFGIPLALLIGFALLGGANGDDETQPAPAAGQGTTSTNAERGAPQPTGAQAAQATTAPPDAQLALLSSNCTREYGFLRCEGVVKNISDKPLRNVTAIVTWHDGSGTPQRGDEGLVDYNPILPGQESPWTTIGTDNPAFATSRTQFKFILGGTIYTRDDRAPQAGR